jgi:adenylate cyclase
MNPWSENRLLKRALALYAGEHVLDHVLRKGDDALRAQSEHSDATVLFVDVAGFEMPSEAMTPEDLLILISTWLNLITNRIGEFGGTLDTYIGDAASSWWAGNGDAPARKACHCAKSMVAELEKLNGEFRAKGWPQVKMKVGINTGRVTLGTYGTAKRLRFTVLGDVVNMASRLCGLAHQQYPHSILVTDSTKSALGSEIPATLVDTVRIKGRDAPLKIYAI